MMMMMMFFFHACLSDFFKGLINVQNKHFDVDDDDVFFRALPIRLFQRWHNQKLEEGGVCQSSHIKSWISQFISGFFLRIYSEESNIFKEGLEFCKQCKEEDRKRNKAKK